ncbi:PTS sugar transporter subunit IIC [Paenibacillus larvae]|uniref:PTS sugar transporter subunit IIC n=2 Tax=Paenibacillus larvae TaxID=1464 RepID=A0AAP5JR69_9BACL|nr:PTS sugar transporter subunit IIC [Paenibacillus larvae]MCY9690375.1 PTS sugar transporter subunit IIC [Paenibacillus larvae]MDT2238023.1 PTS sugar transporter subunit IIC [Paenibacillus larvae]MDT2242557.1 PTS sugar transporter subunit IIC [Paenibacillus larvae]MDT2248341.1 PTS sugar transporter subunit IIC [Paenibacillus larvae]MDT2250444.1 PTS sugar transporter subunit IIC [Paenibacillus larvae]
MGTGWTDHDRSDDVKDRFKLHYDHYSSTKMIGCRKSCISRLSSYFKPLHFSRRQQSADFCNSPDFKVFKDQRSDEGSNNASECTCLVANIATPVVNATLLKVGGIITASADGNPIVTGIILGGVITIVGSSPLS